MTGHRFHVGELVRTHFKVIVTTSSGKAVLAATAGKHFVNGIYEVSRLLPELANGEPQYRIKCDGHPERVVQESQLVSAVLKTPPHHCPGAETRPTP
jgi:hypothetical protein